MRQILFIIYWGFLICTTIGAAAQPNFSMKVSATQLNLNESFELKLLVENAKKIQFINPPSLKDFIIISGPTRESGSDETNGISAPYVAISYQLQPRRKGKFYLNSSKAQADGIELKSLPISVTVGVPELTSTNALGSTVREPNTNLDLPTVASYEDLVIKKGEAVAQKTRDNIFVEAQSTRKQCYVGEPVEVFYKVYTRLKSETNTVKSPSLNGFSVIDVIEAGSTEFNQEQFHGRTFNVYTLRRAQIYPMQAGNLAIDPMEVDNQIQFVKDDYLLQHIPEAKELMRTFSTSDLPAEAVQIEKLPLKSNALALEVKPLPMQGQPAQFSGAVGHFTIQAICSTTTIHQQESIEVFVTIGGQGNMQLLSLPDLKWPEGMLVSEPQVQDSINNQTVPLSGKRTFKFTVSFEHAGAFQFPAIPFSFFDPEAANYHTLSTTAIPFQVDAVTANDSVVVGKDRSLSTRIFDQMFTNRLWIIGPLVFLVLLFLGLWVRRETKKQQKNQQEILPQAEIAPEEQSEKETQQDPFERAESLLYEENSKAFYAALKEALLQVFFKKNHLPSYTAIPELLAQWQLNGASSTQVAQFCDWLKEIDLQLYTPFPNDELKLTLLVRAKELIA
ncbi:MAG: hypothetical protein RLY16_772 [Bacteroidota bacterium]